MEATLGGIKNLGLGAELGYLQVLSLESTTVCPAPRVKRICLSQLPPGRRGRGKADPHWRRMKVANTSPWRDLANPVLLWYTMRTNGSYVKWQESGAQWHYQDADPDFGRFQVGSPPLARFRYQCHLLVYLQPRLSSPEPSSTVGLSVPLPQLSVSSVRVLPPPGPSSVPRLLQSHLTLFAS